MEWREFQFTVKLFADIRQNKNSFDGRMKGHGTYEDSYAKLKTFIFRNFLTKP